MSTVANTSGLTPKEIAQVAKIRAQRFGNPEGFKPRGLDKDLKSPDKLTQDLELYSQDLQTDWNAFRLQDMSNALGESLQDILDSVGVAVDTVRPVVTLIRTALEFILQVASAQLDLLGAIFEAAILLLEGIIDLFNTTRLAELSYIPKHKKMFKSTSEVLNLIADSYDDKADTSRPISRSTADTHVFVGLLPAFADYSKLIEVLKELSKLFKFNTAGLKVKEFNSVDYPNDLYNPDGQSAYPDWNSMSLGEFSFVASITRTLNEWIASLRTANKKTDALLGVISTIEKRLLVIESKIQQLLTVLEALINLSLLPINTLTIFGPGDIAGVQASLRSATSLKTSPLEQQQVDICAAVCMHFVLGSGRSLEFVRKLFAIKDTAIAAVADGGALNTQASEIAEQAKTVRRTYKNSRDQMQVIWRAPTSGQGET
jgi:hypothetical protein